MFDFVKRNFWFVLGFISSMLFIVLTFLGVTQEIIHFQDVENELGFLFVLFMGCSYSLAVIIEDIIKLVNSKQK